MVAAEMLLVVMEEELASWAAHCLCLRLRILLPKIR
jgi:hypothetical protein